MGTYDRQIQMCLNLVSKKGQKVIYRRCITSTKSWEGDDLTFEDIELSMAFIPVDRVDHETMLYREFSDIPIGFEIGYMGVQPFLPSTKDQIIRGNLTYSVRTVTTYRPNDQIVAHVLGLFT